MRVCVGDVSLFVEVVGTKLEVAAETVVERPTVVLLHGGPAWDHLTLLPEFSALSDVAQLIFYDHRGLGRSDPGDRATWTLSQWAEDLNRLITVLGLGKPIVFGQSFGGMVAQQFAVDYPDAYSGLILSSTAARIDLEGIVATFKRLGGEPLSTLARAFFTGADPSARDKFLVEGMPFYTRNSAPIGARSPFKPDVLDHFFSATGEAHRMDFRGRVRSIVAPTLIIGGDSDPVVPASAIFELAESFAPGVATAKIFDHCGHGPTRDQPEQALQIMRGFIAGLDAGSTMRDIL